MRAPDNATMDVVEIQPNRRITMNALKTSLRTLSCIAALGALVAAAPLPAVAQAANPCAPKATKAANPCAPKANKAANPCAPAAKKAANPCAPKK
ncbi:hypothetical protein [Bradyrhizobium sp.]|uniref:hypothetical protein n=1 Tax=Bradyrhizobium sp. TaxID=376 RepID=UPI004037DAFE